LGYMDLWSPNAIGGLHVCLHVERVCPTGCSCASAYAGLTVKV
jgi:hypothetical protein